MQSSKVRGDDTSVTHLSLDMFDASHADQLKAQQLVLCLYRKDAVPQMRQHIALPVNNKQAKKRVLAITKSDDFRQAWRLSVPTSLGPVVDAIWQAWKQQRGTDRQRMRRLRRLFRLTHELRECFPTEVVRDGHH